MISMQNNNGFTLVEIMVAALLVSVMTLATSSVLISNQTNFNNFENNQLAINELNRLSYYVNKYFSQAVNINYEVNNGIDFYFRLDNPNANPRIGHVGKVIIYNSTEFNNGAVRALTTNPANSGSASNIELMALSLMENSKSALNVTDSEFAAIGMYFQRPTPQTYGQIIIQKDINFPSARRLLSPGINDDTQSALIFERLVEAHVLKVYPEDVVDEEDITAMDLKFVARSFIDGNSDNWHWCPTSFMSTTSTVCPAITVNDKELFITVTFRNNLIQNTPSNNLVNTKISTAGTIGNREGSRPLGPIYFFQTNFFPKE